MSANTLPAGCKAVKLNLTGAYRTTYTHIVAGDVVRVVEKTVYGLSSASNPVVVSHLGYVPAPTQAPKASFWVQVTEVERNGGKVTIHLAGGRVLEYDAAHTSVTRQERKEETAARLATVEKVTTQAVAAAESIASGTAASLPVVHAFNHDPAMASSATACGTQGVRGPADAVTCPEQACQAFQKDDLVKVTGGYFAGKKARFIKTISADRAEVHITGRIYSTTVKLSELARDLPAQRQRELARIYGAESIHDFESSGTGLCGRMVLRPDDQVAECGEPVNSPIHDPATYLAYAAELRTELDAWSRGEEYDAASAAVETAFPSVASPDRQALETMKVGFRRAWKAAARAHSIAVHSGSELEKAEALGAWRVLDKLARDLGLA